MNIKDTNNQDDVEQFFDDMLENDPAFRNTMEAMAHTAGNADLNGFDVTLVGSIALAYGDGLSEQEWLNTLADDLPLQIELRLTPIKAEELPGVLEQSIRRIRYYGLWPWA